MSNDERDDREIMNDARLPMQTRLAALRRRIADDFTTDPEYVADTEYGDEEEKADRAIVANADLPMQVRLEAMNRVNRNRK